MEKASTSDRPLLWFLILYTLISGGVYFYVLYFYIPSDMGAHIQILLRFLENDSFPTPPLYYALVYGLHFFMPYKEGYGMAALLVLTASAFLKFTWTARYFVFYCPEINRKLIGTIVFALMFFAPVTLLWYEGEYWYLGKFTSVLWHNSTTLLSFPFCILLFYCSIRYLEERSFLLLGLISIVSVIILLIKPSFLFAFIPAFPFIVFLKDKQISESFFYTLAISGTLLVFIFIEKVIIYNIGMLDNIISGQGQSGIGLRPFYVWLFWTDQPIADIVTSFAFPLVFITFYCQRLIKDYHFLYSSLLVAISLVIFLLFVENGPRLLDGNFYWQIILSLFVWYMVLGKNLLLIIFPLNVSDHSLPWFDVKNMTLIALFLIHVLSGFAYLAKILFTEDFL